MKLNVLLDFGKKTYTACPSTCIAALGSPFSTAAPLKKRDICIIDEVYRIENSWVTEKLLLKIDVLNSFTDNWQ